MMKFNEEELDRMLAEQESRGVSSLVKSLPEDQVSLAWRSSLNEKLIAAAPKRKSRFTLWLRPALGMGLAGALMLLALNNMQPNVAPVLKQKSNLEARLLSDHQSSVALYDLSGPGLAPEETEVISASYEGVSDSMELDLGSL